MQEKIPMMKVPCNHCPFRKDTLKGWLGKERITEILSQESFVCHKTLKSESTRKQCAGHMLLLGFDNEFYLNLVRFGLDGQLSGKHLIFSTTQDCINHHLQEKNIMSAQANAVIQNTNDNIKSAKAITTATTGLSKVLDDLNKAVELVETTSEEVRIITEKKEVMEASYKRAQREAAADLEISIKEDREAVLKDLMREFGLAQVTNVDYTELTSELETLSEDFDKRVQTEVYKRTEALNVRRENEVALAVKDAEIAEATNTARIKELEGQVKFYQQQEELRRSEAKDQREAEIAIAEARAKAQAEIAERSSRSQSK